MKFDISKFERLKDDGDMMVLKHPDGHKLHVSKASLEPKIRSRLAELKMADGGEVPEAEPTPWDQIKSEAANLGDTIKGATSMFQGFTGAPEAPATVPMDPQSPAAPAPAAPEAAPAPQNFPLQAQRAPQSAGAAPMPMPGVAPGMVEEMKAAYAQQEKGLLGEAEAAAKGAEAQAALRAEEAKQAQEANKLYQDQLSRVNMEIDKVTKEFNEGKIDPNHWWNSKSDGAKAQTVIGLLLGGIGAGLTGKNNMAADYIDQQIDRDLAAQKMNLGKKENLLNAYYRQVGNINDAAALFRASRQEYFAKKIEEAGLKSQDPQIRNRAIREAGALRAQKVQTIAPFSMKQALLGGIQMGKVSPAVAIRALPEHDQEPARKELEQAQMIQKKLDNALATFDSVAQAKSAGFMAANPRRALSGAAENQFNAAVVELARDASGAYNEKEVEKLEQMFKPALTDTAEDLEVKRRNMIHFMQQKANFATLEGYGLKPEMVIKPRPNPNAKYGKR